MKPGLGGRVGHDTQLSSREEQAAVLLPQPSACCLPGQACRDTRLLPSE